MNQEKINYANKAKDWATAFAKLLSEAEDMVEVWDHRFYGPGAANEITELDMAIIGYAPEAMGQVIAAPADLYALVIACSQIGKFVTNDTASVPGPYSATCDRLRRDM